MEIITAKDFEDKNNIETIEKLIRMNDGYITSKQITEMGIHRMYLNIMKKRGLIKKVGNGIYIDKDKTPDPYYILSMELPNVVFSHISALYLHNIAAKEPKQKFDITVPNNYFNYKIKDQNVFYVNKEIYELGLTRVETSMGNLVKAYDPERCICDIIKSKKRIDHKVVMSCIKEYLSMRNRDLIKLFRYAYKLGIREEVISIIDSLE